MSAEIYSENPAVSAVLSGTAPRPARLAASRGLLPLAGEDMLELLVGLSMSEDAELAANARETLSSQEPASLEATLRSERAAPNVLSHFARTPALPVRVYEALLANPLTPVEALETLASTTTEGSLLELISMNQQLLISHAAIIQAILKNPNRSAEAERRATETKREFFEKERGTEQIVNELRAQGKDAAAEFIENAEFASDMDGSGINLDDAMFLASMIEVPDDETDDSWMSLEYIEEFYEETEADRQAIFNKILGEMRHDEDIEVSSERVSILNSIMKMGMKDRVRLAMKGDREARNILIRDPNRIVSQAVVQNPRITEQEVEKIAAMRSVPEDILRKIANDRQWARSYSIVHNLARNPRTPLASAMTILTRLQLRDLIALSKNKNVSDNVRRQAGRLSTARTGR